MKLNKIFLGLLGLGAMVMSACSSSDDYEWAKLTGGNQVYFSNELPSSQTLSMSSTSFTIPVSRVSTNDAQTVNISLTSDDNAFSAPSSVSFAAGASTADLVISYDPEALGYDNKKNATLTITDTDQTNAYGNSTYSFTAVIPSPYKTLGKGTITENFIFGGTASVTIMQNTQNPNEFRIMSAFDALAKATDTDLDGNQEPYIQLTLLQPGDTFYDVTITKTGLVGYTDINTGYYHSSYDADIYMLFPGRMTKYAAESYFLHNYVMDWQENGLPGRIQLAPYHYMFGVGGWDHTQNDGYVTIDFPGYAPKDFSAAIEFFGSTQGADGNAYATIFAELGADATNVKAAVVSADSDVDAVADALASGDLEGVDVQSGINFVTIEEGLTGNLMVVLAVISDGVAKNTATAEFEYYGGGKNPWKSLGKGYLYDNLFVTQFYEDAETEKVYDPQVYEVEILENEENPGMYRIVNAFEQAAKVMGYSDYYTPTNVEVNATVADGVYMLPQLVGLDEYGVSTVGGYYLSRYDFETLYSYGYFGKNVDGVISFPSFNYKDQDSGEVLFTYQGFFHADGKAYYSGDTGEFKIVLPSAVAGVKAKARSAAKASDFARRLNGNGNGLKKQLKKVSKMSAPIVKEQIAQ